MKGKVPAGRVYVPGYTKKDGTVIKGYYREAGRGGSPTTSTAAQRQAAQAIRYRKP